MAVATPPRRGSRTNPRIQPGTAVKKPRRLAPKKDPQLTQAVAELSAHAQAERLPALSAHDFEALRTNIARRGVQVPLEVTAAGVVLNGLHRLKAARETGLERVPVRVVKPADEHEHVLLAALLGRHLTPSQKAALALELEDHQQTRAQAKKRQIANLRQNATEEATLPPRGERSRDTAAKIAGVSARTVQDVSTVRDHDPALFEQIKQGKLAAHTAASRVRRSRRDAQLPPPAPLPEGPFDLILADPPWQMGSPDSPFSPEQHYPTMPLQDIKAMRPAADDNAILFLWAVNSLLPEALDVLQAWGFNYRSNMVWVKQSIGPGVWLRQRHELLLVGTKGHFPAPQPTDRCDSVIEAKRGRHSEKPVQTYERIEQMYPEATRLELFARGTPRTGWNAWGNETSV